MTLLLVFAMLVVGLTALFLGVSVVAHGYLYMEPAKALPLRSLAGGLVLGGFITLWAALDKSNPGKYDTFFNFSPYTTAEFTEFEAVRWPVGPDGQLKGTEEAVTFKRTVGGKGAAFVEEGTAGAFKLSTGAYMTGAIRVKGPGDPEPVRYNALVNENPRTKMKEYAKERRFVEEKGERYVEAVQMGTLFVPSSATVAVALLLNFMLLVLWLLVTWPVLRYAFVHAIGLTAVGTLVTMLLLMPLLFKFNRPAEPKPAADKDQKPAVWRAGSVRPVGRGRSAARGDLPPRPPA